jgi:hypothetical protein
MLRASSEHSGTAIHLAALTDDAAATTSGVEHGSLLLAFAEAMVGEDDEALTHVRHAVIEGMSPAAMVDAAGVASNFERMVRIADATGIPLDARMQALSQEVRDALHLERFTVYKELA